MVGATHHREDAVRITAKWLGYVLTTSARAEYDQVTDAAAARRLADPANWKPIPTERQT